MSGPQCKSKWKSLRDYFFRRLKNGADVNGDELAFLIGKKNGTSTAKQEQQNCAADDPDDLDIFFRSLACTMRKLPLTEIACLKKTLLDVVSQKEIALNQQNSQTIQIVYEVQGEENEAGLRTFRIVDK